MQKWNDSVDANKATFRHGAETVPPSRSFRASSYDPFAVTTSKTTMSSPYRIDRTAYSRPSYSGMSQSYHDYTTPTRNRSNRYGSSEQLLYKSPFISSSGHGSSSSYRSSSNFTKASSVGFSLPETSISYRDYTSSGAYSTNSAASRYRPTYSSATSSFYQPKSSFDYRSKTPSYERDSNLHTIRHDRDSRSMSRSEKTPLSGSEDGDMERAYQRLYNKYVKGDSDAESGNGRKGKVGQRSFVSQSETEGECSSEEESTKMTRSLAETLGSAHRQTESSLTTPATNCSNSPDATPKCSPMMARKGQGVSATALPAQVTSDEDVMPTSTPKQAPSTTDDFLRRDPLTTKPSEVAKRTETPLQTSKSGEMTVSETPSRSATPNIDPHLADQNGRRTSALSNEASSTDSKPKTTDVISLSTVSSERQPSQETNASSSAKNGDNHVINTYKNAEVEVPSLLPTANHCAGGSEITSTDKVVNSIDGLRSKCADTKMIKQNDDNVTSGTEGSLISGEPTTNVTIPLSVPTKAPESRSVSPSHDSQKDVKRNTSQLPSDSQKHDRRKRRDPTRTLDNLKEKLEKEKNEDENATTKQMSGSVGSDENDNETKPTNKPHPPMLLVTEAQVSTNKASSQALEESTDCDWTEAEDEADYESDFEYSVSQTFSLKDALPIGDLYPLSRSSSRCSPFVSDYDSDASMPLFMLPSREAESRGRIDRLFAVPPPSFTCSITYDGQESWDEESLHSCTEFDEDCYGRLTRLSRPGSSALGAYLSPAAYSSDEDFDGTHFHDEVDVGCTLRLVDKAALRGDTDDDSDYYDDEEYDEDEEYWDENEEHEAEEACDDEEFEEETEECEGVDEMHSIEESPDEESTNSSCSLVVAQPAEVEENINFEEANDVFDVDMTIELAQPQLVRKPMEYPKSHREVTYTKDLKLMVEAAEAEPLKIDRDQVAKAIKKRVVKDGTSEKVATSLITQRVLPTEELADVNESSALPDEEVHQLYPQHHEDDKGTHDVTVVPTYVQPQSETVVEESTSRFSNKKMSTDFARKAVIQPTKLHTAAVQQVEAKVAPEQTPAALEKPTEKNTSEKKGNSSINDKKEEIQSKIVEDKSMVRKSVLNMKLEEARCKAAVDEEAAKQKARRFGTVSSLLNRFKEPEIKEEPITYKRSWYLQQQEVERPKKQYNIIKPAINDDFDKQMEEIRAQMKSGSSQFQSNLKDLSKGITMTSEDIKKRTEDEKKKIILDSVSGVFSKAEEENARWKEKRDAETEKELAKIEAEKHRKKKIVVEQPKTEPEKPAELKRTVRKITKDKASTEQLAAVPTRKPIETFTKGNTADPTSAPAGQGSGPTTASFADVDQTALNSLEAPKIKPISMEKPKIPKTENVVNENNYDLFEAATNVATRRGKNLVEQREQQRTAAKAAAESKEISTSSPKSGPKGDGAAATKIRNALGNFTNVRKTDSPVHKLDGEKPLKRYSTRRKTQEIVNESAEPKVKKRKQMYKRNRFIRDPHDIDVLLGWDKENTFEKMDQMFSRAANDRISGLPPKKRKRLPASKIWISDLTDIDKIYKMSEIRDIIASANA